MKATQQGRVAAFYDKIADKYDEQYEGRADYQLPHILRTRFVKNGFKSGTILDIGCGTGKLNTYLDHTAFSIEGIEISANMAYKAMDRGYRNVYYGAAEDVLPLRPTKSVDHVVALSSLYFIQNIDQIIWEAIRIARKSIFVSLEQFDEVTRTEMLGVNDLGRWNHSAEKFGDATVLKNIYLWKRPDTGKQVYGDVVHKVLQGP